MKIIIVGDGKVGFTLAERLSGEGHDITMVDNNASVLRETQDELDILTVVGNGAALETLNSANAQSADLLIAVTSADEVNLLCCLSAKKLGCRSTIARVRNPQYSEQASFLKDELGLSMTVNPDLAAAQEIYRLIQFPSFIKRDSFDKGRVELVEMQIPEGSPLDGKKIAQSTSILGFRVLICAVERNNTMTIPNGSFVLRHGDRITVTAARSGLVTLIKQLGLVQQKIRNVVIIGCSRTAEYLADELLKSNVSIRFVDKEPQVCERFSLKFPSALIINADASKHGTLDGEAIEQTDAVITLTGIDEENLIISMYYTHIGVAKTITKIDRKEYTRLFADRGIGSIVCPKELTANEITRYVRAMRNSNGSGSVLALHRIVDGKAEALEFSVTEKAQYTDIPLSSLRLKPDMLITCISRNNQVIIPRGDDVLTLGDTVVVVTTADKTVCELRDIFEKDAVKQ